MRTPEQVRESERIRNAQPHRVLARAEYQKKNPELLGIIKKRWAKRNPEKRAAHVKVGNAVRDGRLVKQPCEVCGNKKVQAHHDDYSRPLEVRWLCKRCHTEHHWGRGELK